MSVERERRGDVAVLRMGRGKVNAIDVELLRDLAAALDETSASTARAVVLTGGGTAFSAGVDLFRLVDGGAPYIREFLPLLESVLERLYALPKPTVAAVNGHAIAGGHLLMACCDRRLMAEGAGKVGVPELLVGVPFPPLALEILAATLAPDVRVDLVYTGRTVGAAEALARGIVHELAEPASLLERAVAEAERLAAVPTASYTLTKRAMVAPALARAARLAAEVGAEVAAAWEAPETAERIRDYLARTVGRRA